MSLLVLTLLPSMAASQPTRERTVTFSLESRLHPAFRAFGVSASTEIVRGLSVSAKVRQVWSSLACTERTPTPCDQDGFGIGVGALYTSPSAISRWPYVELIAGGHHYADYNRCSGPASYLTRSSGSATFGAPLQPSPATGAMI